MMLVMYAVFIYVLKQTAWGKHLYATGDDPEAARLAGIRTNRVLLSAYVVAGAVIGIGAWILIGRINGADPNSGLNMNLQTITAVVIGGHEPLRRPRCRRRLPHRCPHRSGL